MRIRRLDLISFGHHRDVRLELLPPQPGVVVVLGPNEAGKSTAMRAISALLFGIPRQTPDHFGAGRPSLRVGAVLQAGDGTQVEVVRLPTSGDPLVDSDGHPVHAAVISDLLGHIERPMFERLCRFDHHELTEGSKAVLDPNGEIGRLIFGAAMGGPALTAMVRALEEAAAKRFTRRGRDKTIVARLADYDARSKAISERRIRSAEWKRLNDAVAETERALHTSEAALAAASLAYRTSDLLVLAEANLSKRRRLLASANAIRAAGPIVGPKEAEHLLDLLDAAAAAETAASDHLGELAKLNARTSALRRRPELMARRVEIETLVSQTGRYAKDFADVPKLEGALAQAGDETRERLQRAGLTEATADVVLTAPDMALNRITELARRHEQIVTDIERTNAEIIRLNEELDASAQSAPPLPDTAVLEAATRSSEAAAEGAGEWERRRRDAAAWEVERSEIAGLLGCGGRPATDIVELNLPSLTAERHAVARCDSARAAFDVAERSLDDMRRGADERRAELEAHLDASAAPDFAALTNARQERNTAWSAFRDDALSGQATPGHAARVDGAIAAADDVVDRRYQQAEQVAAREQLQLELQRAEAGVVAASARRDQAQDDLTAAEAEWSALWAPVGVVPLGGDAAQWRHDHARFVDVCRKLAEARERLKGEDEHAARRVAALRDALAEIGVAPTTDDEAQLLAIATERLRDVRQRRDLANTALGQREAANKGLARAQQSAESLARERAEWDAEWMSALGDVGLPESVKAAEGATWVSQVAELRNSRKNEAVQAGRLEGLRRDIAVYERDARAVLVAVGVTGEVAGAEGQRLEAAVKDLNEQLVAAREAESSADDLAAQIQEKQSQLTLATDAAAAVSGELAAAVTQLGLDAADVSDTAQRSIEVAALDEQIAEIERDTEYQTGRKVAELEADIDAITERGSTPTDERERIERQLEDLRTENGTLRQTLGAHMTERAKVDGSEAAADAEQLAEGDLAALGAEVEAYMEEFLAAELLSTVIADYAASHQGPILGRAGDLFAELTGGSFAGLHADDTQLHARRADGSMLEMPELSTGTGDQLYLALRLAALEHQLAERSEPLPLIVDDLLVNFDETRAAAAVRVLADLGQKTQVVMFTHSQNLAALATATLGEQRCSVVRLGSSVGA